MLTINTNKNMKKYYDKLVRDKIPQIIHNAGGRPWATPIKNGTLRNYALKKLQE